MKYTPILLLSTFLAACAPTQQVSAISTTKSSSLSNKLGTTNPAAFSPDGQYVVSYDRIGDCAGIKVIDTKTNVVTASICLNYELHLLSYSDDGRTILASGYGQGNIFTADKLQIVGQPLNVGGYAEDSVVYTGATWVKQQETYDAVTGLKLPGAPKQSGRPIFAFTQGAQTYVVRQDDETVRIYPVQSKNPSYSTPGRFAGYLGGTLLVRQDRKLIAQRPFTNATLNVFDLDKADHIDTYEFGSELQLHLPESTLMSPDVLVYLADADAGTNLMILNLKTGESTLVKTTEAVTCVIPDRANNRVALCGTGELVALPTIK